MELTHDGENIEWRIYGGQTNDSLRKGSEFWFEEINE